MVETKVTMNKPGYLTFPFLNLNKCKYLSFIIVRLKNI